MTKEIREEVRVKPVHRFNSGGVSYSEEYSYSDIHLGEVIDNIDSVFDVPKAEAEVVDGEIHYQYEGKPKVIIREDGVYAEDDESIEEAENQAYFVLSMMAGSGYVSNWRKH